MIGGNANAHCYLSIHDLANIWYCVNFNPCVSSLLAGMGYATSEQFDSLVELLSLPAN